MVDKWLVFGGWAMPPQVLAPLFGPRAVLIDTNTLMPYLVRDNALVKDWHIVLTDFVTMQVPDKPFGIAGWSTGSILACALAHLIKPACGVFISATPSFCRRSGFPYGWKPAALKAMREELASAPEQLMRNLDIQCGIEPFSPVFKEKRGTSLYDAGALTSGLFFLEQVNFLPVKPLPFPALFLHGKDDVIIPSAAGKYFSDAAGGTFVEYNGPHAFFLKQSEAVADTIRRFSEKTIS